jgi:hypothetical protein
LTSRRMVFIIALDKFRPPFRSAFPTNKPRVQL